MRCATNICNLLCGIYCETHVGPLPYTPVVVSGLFPLPRDLQVVLLAEEYAANQRVASSLESIPRTLTRQGVKKSCVKFSGRHCGR